MGGLAMERERLAEGGRHLPVALAEGMGVDPKRHRRVGMSESSRHRDRIETPPDRLGCREVPELVRMHWYAYLLGHARDEMGDDGRHDRLYSRRRPREYEGVLGDVDAEILSQRVHCRAMTPQYLDRQLVEPDPATGVGLHALQRPSPPCFSYTERAMVSTWPMGS